jgi:hypothetical protein
MELRESVRTCANCGHFRTARFGDPNETWIGDACDIGEEPDEAEGADGELLIAECFEWIPCGGLRRDQ